ncbi:MAG: DUF1559 domain-containing protein [Planctomycetes bacterium]|nr:DUF1559 domain-containing protein [Planctomycetota bacterium]
MGNRFVLLLVLLLCAPAAAAAEGIDPGKAVVPFLDEQTVAVVRVDLSRLDVDGFFRWLARVQRGDPRESAGPHDELRRLTDGLGKVGVREVYVVLSLADLPEGPPLVVFPVGKGTDVKALKSVLAKSELIGNFLFEEREGALIGSSGETLKRLRGAKPRPRPEFARALDAAGAAIIQIAAAPTPALRRSLTEALPTLPRELGGAPTKLVAEGVEWVAAGFDLPPKANLRVVVKGTDAATAKGLRELAAKLLVAVGKENGVRQAFPRFDKVTELLTPKVESDRLTLALKGDELTVLLVPVVRAQREAAERARSMSNLRQLALAMLNYHDKHNHFPAAVSTDKQNKRLLSWRVHLLPHLDQEKLYKEFKLDEPWDSEHNKKLIKKMPKVFASASADPRLARDGKTTYLVPVGLDTIFPGSKPIKITEITDGTSLTIMLVEGEDDRAVVWTKPEDWTSDPKDPARGLRNHGGKGYLTAFADGSARFLPAKIDPATLRALLTRNGEEIINLP